MRRPPKGRWVLEAWLVDAFCSTECAKAFHGVQFRPSPALIDAERDHDLTLADGGR